MNDRQIARSITANRTWRELSVVLPDTPKDLAVLISTPNCVVAIIAMCDYLTKCGGWPNVLVTRFTLSQVLTAATSIKISKTREAKKVFHTSIKTGIVDLASKGLISTQGEHLDTDPPDSPITFGRIVQRLVCQHLNTAAYTEPHKR